MERHKRSIFARDCGDTASNGTLLPEQQLTSSRPNVTFGQYEKTVNWYANVSWNPVKDPDGVFKGYLVNLGFGSRLGILCSVLPKIQSIPSNVSDHEMESFVNDVRIPTSTSPSTPRTTMAETTAKTTVETSTAAKAPTREITSKGATKTI